MILPVPCQIAILHHQESLINADVMYSLRNYIFFTFVSGNVLNVMLYEFILQLLQLDNSNGPYARNIWFNSCDSNINLIYIYTTPMITMLLIFKV